MSSYVSRAYSCAQCRKCEVLFRVLEVPQGQRQTFVLPPHNPGPEGRDIS